MLLFFSSSIARIISTSTHTITSLSLSCSCPGSGLLGWHILLPSSLLPSTFQLTGCGCSPCPCSESVTVAKAIGIPMNKVEITTPTSIVVEHDSVCGGGSKVTHDSCKHGRKRSNNNGKKAEKTSILFGNAPLPEPDMNMPEEMRKKIIRAHMERGTWAAYKDKERKMKAQAREEKREERRQAAAKLAAAHEDQEKMINDAGKSPAQIKAEKQAAQDAKDRAEGKLKDKDEMDKSKKDQKKAEEKKVLTDVEKRAEEEKSEQLEKKKAFESGTSLSPDQKAKLRKQLLDKMMADHKKKNNQDDVDLSLDNTWTSFGHTYQKPYVGRLGPWCFASGVVRYNSSWTDRMTQLPYGCHPRGNLMFEGLTDNMEGRRLDVSSDGNITMWQDKAKPWVSLDGVSFPNDIASGYPIPLAKSWESYPNDKTAKAMYFREEDACMLSGLIQPVGASEKNWTALIGTLPIDCRPQGRIVLNVNQGSRSHRVDILADGSILWVTGNKGLAYLSLDGVVFPTTVRAGKEFLGRGWKAWGGDFRKPLYKRVGKICFLTGLAKGKADQYNRLIGELGEDCRPDGRLLFHVNQHDREHRIDVLPDGRVLWNHGQWSDEAEWLSMDGIRFHVGDERRAKVRKHEEKPKDNEAKEGTAGLAKKKKETKPAPIVPNPSRTTVPVKLLSGFKEYNSKYWKRADVTLVGNMCVLAGFLRTPKDIRWPIMTIPEGCRPKEDLVFSAHGPGHVRYKLKILNNGEVKWGGGDLRGNRWMTLQALTYPAPKAQVKPLKALFGGFQAYKDHFQEPGYVLESGLCVLTGRMIRDELDDSDSIGSLPEECRPHRETIIHSAYAGAPGFDVAIAVQPSGRITWRGPKAPMEVSLDGIVFHIGNNNGDPIQLPGGWKRYSATYRAPMAHKHGKYCLLSGVAKTTLSKGQAMRHNTLIGRLPYTCRPIQRSMFSLRRDNTNYRVDVLTDGRILYISGKTFKSTKEWISYSGIQFMTHKQSPPSKHHASEEPEVILEVKGQRGAVQSQGDNIALHAQAKWVSSTLKKELSANVLSDGRDRKSDYWKPHPQKLRQGGHYVAYKFDKPTVIRGFSISLDNTANSTEFGSLKGFYLLEYTKFDRVNSGTPDRYWIAVDEFEITEDTAVRHVYNLHTDLEGIRAVRLVFTEPNIAFEEVEFFSTRRNSMKMVSTRGIMNGKTNLARSRATPFASSALGPKYRAAYVNDARYGDDNAWFPNEASEAKKGLYFVGLQWRAVQKIHSIAFGRDNSGRVTKFAQGSYTLQIPSTLNWQQHEEDDLWISIGSVVISDATPDFARRHSFNIQKQIEARQIRLVSTTPLVIDELEAYTDKLTVADSFDQEDIAEKEK